MKLSEAFRLWAKKKARYWCPRVREHVARLQVGWLEAFGDVEVSEVTALQVEAYELERDDGKRSASALNQEGGYLKQFFRWAEEHDLAGGQPARVWKSRKVVVRRKYATLSRDEERRVCEVAPLWLRRFILVAVRTGMREGTIRELRVEHLKGGVLEVPAELVKTREPLRVPLPEQALEALAGVEGDRLVPLPQTQQVYRAFVKAVKAAGIRKKVTPHDLRRTFVARLVEQRVPLPVIMKLGGWKTQSTILTHYVTAVPDEEALAVLQTI